MPQRFLYPDSSRHTAAQFDTVAEVYADGSSIRTAADTAAMSESTARRFLRTNKLLRGETGAESARRLSKLRKRPLIERAAQHARWRWPAWKSASALDVSTRTVHRYRAEACQLGLLADVTSASA
ncbi:MAG: hypothetical protein Rubg2KO_15220 [Rubricoccaceae bacterium]